MRRIEIMKNNMRDALALLFMVTYLVALFGGPVHLLSHLEHEAEEVCVEPENACHLKFVHADFSNGCAHDTHLLEDNSFHCDFCATFTGSKTALLIADHKLKTPVTSKSKFALSTSDIFERTLRSEKPRGPPLNS